jgi:hypothetical protein
MEFSSVVLAAPTIRTVHAVPEAESAAERPAMDGGREEGQEEEEKGGYGAGAGRAENAAIKAKRREEERNGVRRVAKE